mmetsp:Transcript_19908/g.35520  ORF Transcript_19908/g.35520 Transcript_19908/m.35520 type:complete len:243 (-) Transcript_19908:403-1131(-)
MTTSAFLPSFSVFLALLSSLTSSSISFSTSCIFFSESFDLLFLLLSFCFFSAASAPVVCPAMRVVGVSLGFSSFAIAKPSAGTGCLVLECSCSCSCFLDFDVSECSSWSSISIFSPIFKCSASHIMTVDSVLRREVARTMLRSSFIERKPSFGLVSHMSNSRTSRSLIVPCCHVCKADTSGRKPRRVSLPSVFFPHLSSSSVISLKSCLAMFCPTLPNILEKYLVNSSTPIVLELVGSCSGR